MRTPIALVAAMLLARSAAAQHPGSLLGVVVSELPGSDAPGRIAGASVQLTPVRDLKLGTLDSAFSRAMRTDDSGYFSFAGLAARDYWMEVRRLGYAPYAGLVTLPAGTFATRVDLQPIARELPTVVTTAAAGFRARLLAQGGFEQRQRTGFGHFVDSAEIARRRPQTVRELLAPYLEGCTMMFMNGSRGALPPGLLVEEVVGIEVYQRSAMAPAAFVNPHHDCGSIVVWFAPPA